MKILKSIKLPNMVKLKATDTLKVIYTKTILVNDKESGKETVKTINEELCNYYPGKDYNITDIDVVELNDENGFKSAIGVFLGEK